MGCGQSASTKRPCSASRVPRCSTSFTSHTMAASGLYSCSWGVGWNMLEDEGVVSKRISVIWRDCLMSIAYTGWKQAWPCIFLYDLVRICNIGRCVHIHAYMHAYLPPYRHTYIHKYIHVCMCVCGCACECVCMSGCVYACICNYNCTYIYNYIAKATMCVYIYINADDLASSCERVRPLQLRA